MQDGSAQEKNKKIGGSASAHALPSLDQNPAEFEIGRKSGELNPILNLQ